jgi:hypothetical protein
MTSLKRFYDAVLPILGLSLLNSRETAVYAAIYRKNAAS